MTDPQPPLTIRDEPLASQVSRSLIARLDAELTLRYPEPGATHFRLEEDEVAPGRGAFLVALLGDEPVGCGALRRLDADTGELKRMYVDPNRRGRRIATQLLDALESRARDLGLTRLVLETGPRQTEAIALYERCGFTRRGEFGEYHDEPLSLYMEKELR